MNYYNSPMQNGMGQMPYNPYNPGAIGNIMPMGYAGYNMGGYYNGIYNNNYSPYYFMEQQKLQQEKIRQENDQRTNIMKSMAKHAFHAFGKEVKDEELNVYGSMEEARTESEPVDYEEQMCYRMLQMNFNPQFPKYNMNLGNAIIAQNKLYDEHKKLYPDSMGVEEFNEISGQLYFEGLDQKRKEQERKLDKLYDSRDYNSIINSRGGNTYFDTLHNFNNNREISIDDMEIPSYHSKLTKEIEDKRQKFLESIFNK